MKWVYDLNKDLINLEQMEYIAIYDRGQDYPERFQILAKKGPVAYLIKEYKSETCANSFLRKLASKVDVDGQ